MSRTRISTYLAVLSLGAVLASCGDGSEPTVTSIPDADTLLTNVADAMHDAASVRFEMERSGAPVFLDGGVLEFVAATGDYAAPDSSQALIAVKAGGLTVEIGSVAIGERSWATNPLTQQWDELPLGSGFNPAMLFDPEVGWRPLLTQDLSAVTVEGPLDGGGRYEVRAIAAGDRVDTLTAGLAGDQSIDLVISIEPDTWRIISIRFSTVGEEGESQWTIGLSDYDAPVTIEPPE